MLQVLIVEDDPDIRDALSMLLQDEGYEPVTAAALDQALALVDERTFALILSDLFARSPDRALDTAVALRDRAHPTPVGLVTGWNVAGDEAAAAGFAFVARKPFDVDDLATGIAAALHRPLGPQEEEQAQVVRAYFDRLTARDWDALADLCTDDVTYVLPGSGPFSTTVQGRAAFRAFTEDTFRTFPAARFEDVRVYATPEGLAARYQSSWLADGRSVQRQAGSVVFQFDGTHIKQVGVRLNDERLRALVEVPRPAPEADERQGRRSGHRPAGSE